METRKIIFLTLLTITTSAFLYMIAKKTDITGTQKISVETFSRWQKKNGAEIVQLRNYIRQKAPRIRYLSTIELDMHIKKAATSCKTCELPSIDDIVRKMEKK